MEFSLLLAAAIGVVAMLASLRWQRSSVGPIDGLPDAATAAVGAGILVGRLASMIGSGTNPLSHPGDILIIRGGVSTGFTVVAALVTWAWHRLHDLVEASDIMAPAALPWAITITGSSIGRHPVELYAAIGLGAAAIVLSRLAVGSGFVAAVAFLVAAGVRLTTAPLRAALGTGASDWYLAGVVVGVLALLAVRRRRLHSSGAHRSPR